MYEPAFFIVIESYVLIVNLTKGYRYEKNKQYPRRVYCMNSYKKTVVLEAGMQEQLLEPLPRFLERLGLDKEPMSCLLPCPIRCLALC